MSKATIAAIVTDDKVRDNFTKAVKFGAKADIFDMNGFLAVATLVETAGRVVASNLADAMIAEGLWNKSAKGFQNRLGEARALIKCYGDAQSVFKALDDYNQVNDRNVIALQGAYRALLDVKTKDTKNSKTTSTYVIDTHELSELSIEALQQAMDAIADEIHARKTAEEVAASKAA